jgi:hypothetical protein
MSLTHRSLPEGSLAQSSQKQKGKAVCVAEAKLHLTTDIAASRDLMWLNTGVALRPARGRTGVYSAHSSFRLSTLPPKPPPPVIMVHKSDIDDGEGSAGLLKRFDRWSLALARRWAKGSQAEVSLVTSAFCMSLITDDMLLLLLLLLLLLQIDITIIANCSPCCVASSATRTL